MSADKLELFNYCKSCQCNCCYIGPILILPDEFETIIKKTGRKDVFRQEDEVYILEKETGKPCTFLDNDGIICTIQDIKPIDCKAWPIYFGKNGSIKESSISPNCPAHKFLDINFINNARKELNKIPERLHKSFYDITIKSGYLLTNLQNKSLHEKT